MKEYRWKFESTTKYGSSSVTQSTCTTKLESTAYEYLARAIVKATLAGDIITSARVLMEEVSENE